MARGKSRNPANRRDYKFVIGKTTINRRNLQEHPADLLFDISHGGNGGNGDEVDNKPVSTNPVEGYPVIKQAGDLKQQIVQVLAEQQAAKNYLSYLGNISFAGIDEMCSQTSAVTS